MKNFKRGWLLALGVLVTALFVSCQMTLAAPQPSQTPVESPPTSPTQADEPSPAETPKSLSYLISSDPAEVDNSDLPITPVKELGITGHAPDVDIAEYRLTVDGLVETPLTLTYEAILAYPAVSEVLLLICPSYFANNAEWTGVPMTTIMAEAGVKPEASEVTFYAIDGYQETLSIEDAQQEGVLLAYAVNGQTLPAEHGYPLRLTVKGKFGAYWVKWLERIDFQ
jgi:DMSO/TMAO reductase YedYZ molybdopterin-dependent catalytic subunit